MIPPRLMDPGPGSSSYLGLEFGTEMIVLVRKISYVLWFDLEISSVQENGYTYARYINLAPLVLLPLWGWSQDTTTNQTQERERKKGLKITSKIWLIKNIRNTVLSTISRRNPLLQLKKRQNSKFRKSREIKLEILTKIKKITNQSDEDREKWAW